MQPSQPEEQTNQVADPSQPGQHDQGTSHSDAEQAQTGAAAAVPLAAVSATAATVTKPPAQRPTLPIADMAALARRIGSSAAASTSHAGAATSQAMSMQPLASHMGHAPSFSDASGGAAVPAELQAIIQKLVAFIKVGPSGRADCLRNSTKYAIL